MTSLSLLLKGHYVFTDLVLPHIIAIVSLKFIVNINCC